MSDSESDHDSETISVIIPAYNAEATLKATVLSALKQTHAVSEVIIVNDGSADGTISVATDLESSYACVRLITTSNGGSGAARNHGLNSANSTFVVFLDADDLMLPRMASTLLAGFHSPQVVGVGADARYVGAARNRTAGRTGNHRRFDMAAVRAGKLMAFQPSAMLVRRSAALSIGGFDRSLSREPGFPEDLDFLVRLAAVGEFVSMDAVVCLYTLRGSSKSLAEHAAATSDATLSLLKGQAFVAARTVNPSLSWEAFDYSPSKQAQLLMQSRFAARRARLAFLDGSLSELARQLTTAIRFRLRAQMVTGTHAAALR